MEISLEKKKAMMIGAGLGCFTVIFCVTLWQPERQVRLHQRHFLESVEARNWKSMSARVAENYSDRWHHDKSFLLKASGDVFAQFFVLGIEGREEGLELLGGSGTVRTRLKLVGSGSPLADLAKAHVNGLQAPFSFRWEQQSWKPWDWKLVGMDHPEMEIPEY